MFKKKFKNLTYLFSAIIGLAILITVHEFGHFTFAKLTNTSVPTFSIGFGPTILQKQIGETNFKISLLPLGGYVQIAGMDDTTQQTSRYAIYKIQTKGNKYKTIKIPIKNTPKQKLQNNFNEKTYWEKILILSGGSLFNIIFAYLIFILLFLFGAPNSPLFYPDNISTKISKVEEDSPAQKAGLNSGDKILEFNNINIKNNITKLMRLIKKAPQEKPIQIKFTRNNIEQITTIIIEPNNNQLGLKFASDNVPPKPLIQSILMGIKKVNFIIRQFLSGKKQTKIPVQTKQQKKDGGLGGPILIFSLMRQSAQEGFKYWILFLALISLNLGILNLLPFPILDGGQILFVTIETITGKAINITTKNLIQTISIAIFLALLLYLTFKDIKRIRKK